MSPGHVLKDQKGKKKKGTAYFSPVLLTFFSRPQHGVQEVVLAFEINNTAGIFSPKSLVISLLPAGGSATGAMFRGSTKHCSSCFPNLSTILPTLRLRKPWHREVKPLSQTHTASKPYSRSLNSVWPQSLCSYHAVAVCYQRVTWFCSITVTNILMHTRPSFCKSK